jgi:hypothetical protein
VTVLARKIYRYAWRAYHRRAHSGFSGHWLFGPLCTQFFYINNEKLLYRVEPGNMEAKVDAGTEDFHLQIGVLRFLLRQENLK